jgi:hypothetical protein
MFQNIALIKIFKQKCLKLAYELQTVKGLQPVLGTLGCWQDKLYIYIYIYIA